MLLGFCTILNNGHVFLPAVTYMTPIPKNKTIMTDLNIGLLMKIIIKIIKTKFIMVETSASIKKES